jgi:hypothetical protein
MTASFPKWMECIAAAREEMGDEGAGKLKEHKDSKERSREVLKYEEGTKEG